MNNGLTFNTRKALSIQLGEQAGTEIAQLLATLSLQIEELQRENADLRLQIDPPQLPRIARAA